MMKVWLTALCVLGGLCLASEDTVFRLCAPMKGEESPAEYKKMVALAKSVKAIKKGVDAQDKAGQTALMQAAALDNRLVVAYLVAMGADVMRADKAGKTAQDYAVSAPVCELLSACIEQNVTMAHEDREKKLGEMGLVEKADRVKHVKALVRDNKVRDLMNLLRLGVRLEEQDIRELDLASVPSPEMLAILHRRGYNLLDAEDSKARLPKDLNCAKLALALGMQAAEDEKFAADILSNSMLRVKKALAANPKAATTGCGALAWSPLCLVQSAEMVRVLKEAGADAAAPAPADEGEAKGALLTGIIRNRTAGTREAEVVKALLDAGAAVGDSPGILCLLCSEGSASVSTALTLIRAGAKPEETDNTGATALHYAAARGKADTVKALLANKADPNATDADGDTPLHFLLKNCARLNANPDALPLPETIKALIKGGANPKLKTKDGQNALQLAKSLGYGDTLAKAIKSAAK